MDRDRLCAFFNRLQPLVGRQPKEALAQIRVALRELGETRQPAEFVVVRDAVASMVTALQRLPDSDKYLLIQRVLRTQTIPGIVRVLEDWLQSDQRVMDPRIRASLSAIKANLYRPKGCRLTRLAKSAALSPWHFSKLFYKATGHHLPEYVRRVRVEAAGKLLRAHPRWPLNRIAKRTGFSDERDLATTSSGWQVALRSSFFDWVGANNHPTTDCMERLHQAGVKTYWTSRGGQAEPEPEFDTVAGTIIIEVVPGANDFTVKGTQTTTTETFAVWPSSSSPSPATPATTFVWSKKSNVYHLPDCKYVAQISNENRESGTTPPAGKTLHTGCPR